MRTLLQSLLREIRKDSARIIGLRHALHAVPEPANREWQTADLIRRELGTTSHELDTATVVHIGPVDRGSVILRAELDGLEIPEPPHTGYASTNGWMHACGHDIDMAALLGTVSALRTVEDQLPLGVTAVFQPAEETHPSGARRLVNHAEALFSRPLAAIAVHPHPGVPANHVAAGDGTINASSDEFEITIEGRGGHGGYPHEADDVIGAVSATIMAIQQIPGQRVDPLEPVVVSVGSVHSGAAANVLPGSATCNGTVRAMSDRSRTALHRLLEETATTTAAGYGCRASVRIEEGEPPLVNSPALAGAFRRWAAQASLPVAPPFRSMGADDFSFFTEIAPTLMVFAGAPSQIRKTQLHSADYVPHDEAVLLAAAAYCCGLAAAFETASQADGESVYNAFSDRRSQKDAL